MRRTAIRYTFGQKPSHLRANFHDWHVFLAPKTAAPDQFLEVRGHLQRKDSPRRRPHPVDASLETRKWIQGNCSRVGGFVLSAPRRPHGPSYPRATTHSSAKTKTAVRHRITANPTTYQ
ncbi:MAG TPA: hypothetical protein VNL71_01980, partial [Chloroflexota bacterium]|nr:hypothetical protein [Chloroflexota bacterium]